MLKSHRAYGQRPGQMEINYIIEKVIAAKCKSPKRKSSKCKLPKSNAFESLKDIANSNAGWSWSQLCYDCYMSNHKFDITSDYINTFKIGSREIVSIPNPLLKIKELLDMTPAAVDTGVEFRTELLHGILKKTFTCGNSAGSGEAFMILLPVDSVYNSNDGKGDITIANFRTDLKSQNSKSDTSAPSVDEDGAVATGVCIALQQYMNNIIYEFSKKYPILKNRLLSIIKDNPTYMLTPYKEFYRKDTFEKDGIIKCYTIHEFFNLIYKAGSELGNNIQNGIFTKDIKERAIRTFYDFCTKIYPSKKTQENSLMMSDIWRCCESYVNNEYDPRNSEDTIFITEKKYAFKNEKDEFAKYDNTCAFWHHYASIYFNEYLKKVSSITYLVSDRNGHGQYIYIPADAQNIRELSDNYALIFAETHNTKNESSAHRRSRIRLMGKRIYDCEF